LVAATLAAKRREHPELGSCVTVGGLRSAAERERIVVSFVTLPPILLGLAQAFLGRAVITVERSLRGEARRRVVAHELAHHWLGHVSNPLIGAWIADDSGPWWAPRPAEIGLYERMEEEADLLAAALVGVPIASFRAPIEAVFGTRLRSAEAV
jgi:hypothetical protein